AELGRNRILHRLQPRLLRIALVRLEQEVASAGEVEAEADLVLRQPRRPILRRLSADEQARNRKHDAKRDDESDEPDFPAREFEHQSLAGLVFAVSTWLIVDL